MVIWTYFSPIFYFYTPWRFQGIWKGNTELKWVNTSIQVHKFHTTFQFFNINKKVDPIFLGYLRKDLNFFLNFVIWKFFFKSKRQFLFGISKVYSNKELTIYTNVRLYGTGRTPPRKIPSREPPPLKISLWWIPPQNIPPRKTTSRKTPQCLLMHFLYIIKSEA